MAPQSRVLRLGMQASRVVTQPNSSICQACRLSSRLAPAANATSKSRRSVTASERFSIGHSTFHVRFYGTAKLSVKARRAQPDGSPPRPSSAGLVDEVLKTRDDFLARQGLPSEEDTLAALRTIADRALGPRPDMKPPQQQLGAGQQAAPASTASSLLSLDSNGAAKTARAASSAQSPELQNRSVAAEVSHALYDMLAHPTTFITPKVLSEFVRIQAELKQPQALPPAFRLFASKPRAKLGRNGALRLVPQRSPARAANAVDAETADLALDAAIEARDLATALAVVESTVAAPAFARAKLVRRALVPATLLGTAPLGAYAAASQLALLQDTMEPGTATGVAFAGIVAYLGFTAALGAIVIATANDQMRRVTWATGTPLRQRWLREEERAALDKIACAFGFSQETRFGEEEGADFQALREYILQRDMVLDQIELMEGMS